ncbi:doublecortin domain-containing protein 1 [Pelodytes ibericus]
MGSKTGLSLQVLDSLNANELIDELKTAIKRHRGQLSKLAQQLQAEQEQCATYIYQHIKDLPASAVAPQGLHLKVYENGKDSGGTVIFISNKELQNSPVHHPGDTMQQVLTTILHRIQQAADFGYVGLRPSRLFDEKGQEIKNPRSLQNEQKIWFSYGEDFRAPAENVLNLIFDQVNYMEKDGTRIISITFTDPNVPLPGYNSWKLCPSFPENITPTSLQTLHQPDTVDNDRLFLQSKRDELAISREVAVKRIHCSREEQSHSLLAVPVRVSHLQDWSQSTSSPPLASASCIHDTGSNEDLQLVLHPSVRIEKRSRTLGQQGRTGQLDPTTVSALLPCNVWLVTKAYPQFVLTCLEELNVKEVVTQTADQMQDELWLQSQQETGRILSNGPLQNDVTHPNQQQVPEPLVGQLLPTGGPGDSRQLTVALVRKLTEKHPQDPAQRLRGHPEELEHRGPRFFLSGWAIKHEGTSKPGQWKRSKVDNPLWNKLTYMWPVLPTGEINEDFDWPIQGSFISNSPPLEKPCVDHTDSYIPVRLKVLTNGECDKSRACVIVGPNVSNMVKKHAGSSAKKSRGKMGNGISPVEENAEKVDRIEFQQFLERCTAMLNLPSAARRLFNGNGAEIFCLKDVERDELVYVSCGDQWIDPQLSATERKKRILLNSLASDVELIRNYCSLRDSENLVLEICGDISAGTKLTVNYIVSVTGEDEAVETNRDSKPEQTDNVALDTEFHEVLDSHTRSHRRVDALFTDVKYVWQQTPLPDQEENTVVEEDLPQNKNEFRKITKVRQVHRQQFEFLDGQIISSVFPGLAVGVRDSEVHAGVEVLLVDRTPDDMNQHWKYLEDDRTFHLASNPDLVMAVSMPKIYPGLKQTEVKFLGCPIILQKYKEHINGAANQKWGCIPRMKVLGAFHTDQLDKDITAANQASVCTFTVTNAVELSQPGYSLMPSNGKEKMMVCRTCARIMGGRREMVKVAAGGMFFCATGVKDSKLNPLGPFKCLRVAKTDLSAPEAHTTLRYSEEMLSSMASERATQTISHEVSAVGSQRSLKIKAYKNGSGFNNGRLIVAGTFPMLLSLCTKELELPRPACKVYTADGTRILTWPSLIAWAANDFFKHNKEPMTSSGNTQEGSTPVNETITLVNPEDVSLMDEYLLSFILRNPIEVWVSCGEPFLSLHALQRSQKREKLHWLQREKILSDLNGMKHKMRHLQGRRVKHLIPANMVPTMNPSQPVMVEGGWREESNEESELLKNIENVKVVYLSYLSICVHDEVPKWATKSSEATMILMVLFMVRMHLSEIQAVHQKKHLVTAANKEANQNSLYDAPTTKRVLVYLNGGNAEHPISAWGKTMEELLQNSTSRLNMQLQSAEALYTPSGEKVTRWDDVTRDMVLCVSAGEKFLSKTASRHKIRVRANYSRIRRKYGPQATEVVISAPGGSTDSQTTLRVRKIPYVNEDTGGGVEGGGRPQIVIFGENGEDNAKRDLEQSKAGGPVDQAIIDRVFGKIHQSVTECVSLQTGRWEGYFPWHSCSRDQAMERLSWVPVIKRIPAPTSLFGAGSGGPSRMPGPSPCVWVGVGPSDCQQVESYLNNS